MKKSEIQIVWFKRDLRITDHKPIYEASKNSTPTLMLYIVETDYWSEPFANRRHWSFIHDSLVELSRDLNTINQKLIIQIGSVEKVFKDLSKKYILRLGVRLLIVKLIIRNFLQMVWLDV